ncbi:SAM-dependent methyltransferase [Oleidesulfovibrio sp.]|uniref:SAM-dependent methyltransferase n=1 Tax=Oleidesulfovibrio sp. TaxID=2909707 RepID=UPI003A8534F3
MQNLTVYLAAKGYTDDLLHELAHAGVHIQEVRGRLILAQGPAINAAWAQNIWKEPVFLPISSIKDGAKQLKAMLRNWALYAESDHHGRAKLVQAALPHVSAKPVKFGTAVPTAPLGSWTLWQPDTILASAQCTSPFADGEVHFEEDKETPPTRAYLKLWEAFTLLGKRPQAGELCLDLGSSPGGWSWVLAECGAHVFSVDKADLAPHIATHPRINFCTGSAFGLDPRHSGDVDWLCCDVICYPDRLLAMVARWLELGNVRNFVCTLKFQGETDHETARQFAAIPNSHLMHLSCNKHELTWIRLG